MVFPRKAGVLLHPTSLPGPYGLGELGAAAKTWVDQLASAGQTYWQVLPLGPTGYGDSPYQSPSTFAGNPQLIDLADLKTRGLLRDKDLGSVPDFPTDHVDFGQVLPWRKAVLTRVARAFSRRANEAQKTSFKAFCRREAEWLDEYALFAAIKETQALRPWTEWPGELAHREPEALKTFATGHRTELRVQKVLQFLFRLQWDALHEYANEQGVQIIGDVPIFVSHDSADVWARRDLYDLSEDGIPRSVAGVPPDYFSETGQRWGNPLYLWERHENEGYAWWISRMRHTLTMVDVVRIDHFRGFESFWEIPGSEETAVKGRWVQGPGDSLFQAFKDGLGELPVIAEDLGIITDEVTALRERWSLPGMRILQFSFAPDLDPEYQPNTFPENCVVYTGTHDNDTVRGWFWQQPGENNTLTEEEIEMERHRVRVFLETDGSQIHWDLIALGHRLPPHTSIVPLQDVLGLGSEARMNVPGNEQGNWSWRYCADAIDAKDLQRLRDITDWAGRL